VAHVLCGVHWLTSEMQFGSAFSLVDVAVLALAVLRAVAVVSPVATHVRLALVLRVVVAPTDAHVRAATGHVAVTDAIAHRGGIGTVRAELDAARQVRHEARRWRVPSPSPSSFAARASSSLSVIAGGWTEGVVVVAAAASCGCCCMFDGAGQ
jgi:hypothetical protein